MKTNMLQALKTKLRQLLCPHEWKQEGDVVYIKPSKIQHGYYYYDLKCIKCGATKHECVLLTHKID